MCLINPRVQEKKCGNKRWLVWVLQQVLVWIGSYCCLNRNFFWENDKRFLLPIIFHKRKYFGHNLSGSDCNQYSCKARPLPLVIFVSLCYFKFLLSGSTLFVCTQYGCIGPWPKSNYRIDPSFYELIGKGQVLVTFFDVWYIWWKISVSGSQQIHFRCQWQWKQQC